jgi:hypothetical protein
MASRVCGVADIPLWGYFRWTDKVPKNPRMSYTVLKHWQEVRRVLWRGSCVALGPSEDWRRRFTSGRGWRTVWGKERHTVQPRMKWGATVRRRFELVCGATKLCAVNPWGTDTKPGVDTTREAQMGRRKQSESRPTWRGGNFSPQLRK